MSSNIENIIKNLALKLSLSHSDLFNIISNSFKDNNYENFLIDFLGYENIDSIIEIIKNKSYFIIKEIKTNKYIEYIFPKKEILKFNKDLLINTNLIKNHNKYFNYKYFNIIQSKVFESAYKTNKNLLISAPTGAGKTDIALMCILKIINENKKNFKVIYIVPLKALATEIFNKYNKLFKNIIKVIEYTGDTEIDKITLLNANLLICTPEKFDVGTRKNNSLIKNIKLIIIDEIHLLDDYRGVFLEAIVARMLNFSILQQINIRFIGLSATLPNFNDVGSFLKADYVFNFDDSYRPVPLEIKLVSFNKKATKNDENEYLIDLIKYFDQINKQILIFVTSRNQTVSLAKILIEYLPESNIKIDHKNFFNQFLEKAVGIHHAGLKRSERLLMENLFLQKKLKIMICTSTLAWGINLPAYGVIIYKTTFYSPNKCCYDDLSILDVLQIFGRAGRPQYDTEGKAFLITKYDKIEFYLKSIKNKTEIESKLLTSLTDVLLAEIYLNNIKNFNDIFNFIKNTFLYQRLYKNPVHYGILDNNIKYGEQNLINILLEKINILNNIDLINISNTDKSDDNYLKFTFSATNLGKIASLFFISHLTIKNWMSIFNKNFYCSKFTLIKILLDSEEFNNISLRTEEVPFLIRLNSFLLNNNFIDSDYEETIDYKKFLLILGYLNYYQFTLSTLNCDLNYIFENIKRLISAIKEIFINIKNFNLFNILFNLEKEILREKKIKKNIFNIYLLKLSKDFYNIKIIKNNKKNILEKNSFYCIIKSFNKIIYIFYFKADFSDILQLEDLNLDEDLEVEIHSNKIWFYQKSLVKIDFKYSFDHFKNYGVHFCKEESNLLKIKSCNHFVNYEDAEKNSLVYTNINIKNNDFYQYKNIDLIKDKNDKIVLNLKFNINFKFFIIDDNNYKEKLKIINKKIIDLNIINFKEYLIICPDENDVNETIKDLNILIMSNLNNKNFDINNNENVKNFNQIKNIKKDEIQKFKKIIFKLCRKNEIYPIYNILKISNNKEVIIFETENFINFISNVVFKNV